MRKFIKKRLLKFVTNSKGKPLREQFVLAKFARRTLDKGVDPLLVTRGKHLAEQRGLNSGLTFMSWLGRLNEGDYSVVPQITDRITSKEEFNRLLAAHPDVIEKEIATTGEATVLNWMIENELIEFDDPRLRDLVTKRFEWAISNCNGKKKKRNTSFDRSRALEVLLEMKEIFNTHDRQFFLSCGTLLGAVRENGFIANDDDLDIGVFATEASADQCAAMFEGSNFQTIAVRPDYVSLIHAPSKNTIDIFFYFEQQELLRYGTDIHSWWHKPFDLVSHDLKGHEFLIPEKVEEHLTERYGNWQNSTLYFDIAYDGPNHTYNNSLESILYLLNRARVAFAKGWRFYSDEAAFALLNQFNIDYTDYIPQQINKKAIPIPVKDFEIEGKNIVLILDSFDRVDLEQIKRLKDAAELGDYLVAGLLGDDLALAGKGKSNRFPETDRLNTLRALNLVKNVYLISNMSELEALIGKITPSKVIGMDHSDFLAGSTIDDHQLVQQK